MSQKDKRTCQHCGHVMLARNLNYHERKCLFTPKNSRALLIYIKKMVIQNSGTASGFVIIPTDTELEEFRKHNDVLSMRFYRQHFSDIFSTRDEIVLEVIDMACRQGYVSYDDFPEYLRYLYDAYCYLPIDEYKQRKSEVDDYEEREFAAFKRNQREQHLGDMPRPHRSAKRVYGAHYDPRTPGFAGNS